jgi:hypothetical protein
MPGPLSVTRMTPWPAAFALDTDTSGAGGRVGQRVAHQVVGHLGQALGVAQDHRPVPVASVSWWWW